MLVCARIMTRPCLLALLSGGLASVAIANPLQIESKSGTGGSAVQGNGNSSIAVISPTSDYIVFRTSANNFPDGSSNQPGTRIIRRNRTTGAVSMINGSGVQESPPLSGERVMGGNSFDIGYRGGTGPIVWSNDSNQGSGLDLCPDTNNFTDLYKDGGAPPPFSWTTGGFCGTPSNGNSISSAMSWDKAYVVFESLSTTFTAGDTALSDIFTVNVSGSKVFSKKSVTGNILVGITAANGGSFNPDAGGGTDDNPYVWVFESDATNLAGADTLGFRDIFARVEPTGITVQQPFTQRISVSSGGGEANGASFTPSVSKDGRYVVYSSNATNIAGTDGNGKRDIYLRDRQNATNKRISIAINGAEPNADCLNPKISGDGNWVAFESAATNLIPNRTVTGGFTNIYVVNVASGTIHLVSYGYDTDTFANANCNNPSINFDGSIVTFDSTATNLVSTDSGATRDVFSWTRTTYVQDNCSNAWAIDYSLGQTVAGSTVGADATAGQGNTCGTSQYSADMWYKLTAGCDGAYSFDTEGSEFDTVLSVYASCGGTELACNDDFAAPQRWSKVTLNMTSGQTVYVRIAGFQGKVGDYNFTAKYLGAAPSNDSCANATNVGIGTFPYFTCGATTDGPTVTACGSASQIRNDVWFRFTAPTNGLYSANVCNSTNDTVMAVYNTGSCPVNGGQQIACNDDTPNCGPLASRVQFNAVGGQTYMVRVGGYDQFTGIGGSLTINRVGCSPADIADDAGNAPPQNGMPNGGVNEGDYNAFFQGFFNNDPACDIADNQGTPLPPWGNPAAPNGGVNEGDYNCFFQYFFQGCI